MNARRVILIKNRCGFTLVELLVVIGIIALLISILLPSLRRAKQGAQSVKCLSNLKQISCAMVMWSNDHWGLMPSPGNWTQYGFKSPQSHVITKLVYGSDYDRGYHNTTDWIAWSTRVDMAGLKSTSIDQNITCSALAPYMNIKYRDHDPNNTQDYQHAMAANTISSTLGNVFRCPADDYMGRGSGADESHSVYRYSYAMNSLYSNAPGPTAVSGFKAGVRSDGTFNGKLSSIGNPSEKVLIIDEDERSLDDAAFTPDPDNWIKRTDLLATHHSARPAKTTSLTDSSKKNENGTGNVAFADGHAGVMTRLDVLRRRYSGNPKSDSNLPLN